MKPKTTGRLTLTSLGGVIDSIIRRKHIGAILVSDGLSEKCFYFSMGGIRLLSTGPRKKITLEEVLLKKGWVDHKVLARAHERLKGQEEKSLLEVMAAMEALEPDQIRQAGVILVQEELFDLFLWENAQIEYYAKSPPQELYDPKRKAETFSFNLESFFEDTRERIEEVKKIKMLLSSEKVVLVATFKGEEDLASGDFSPLTRRVFRLVEGEKRLDEILVATKIDQFNVLKSLRELLQKGDLKIVRVDKEGRDLREEINDMETALDRAISKLVVHLKLGKAYEQAGQKEKAGHNYKKAAVTMIDHERDGEAIEILTRVSTITPNDFEAQERLTHSLFRVNRIQEAIERGMILGEKYREFGLLRRALSIFQAIFGKASDNLKAHRLLVETHIDLGNTADAIREGLELARNLEQREMVTEVFDVYKKLIRAGADPDLFRNSVKGIKEKRRGVVRKVVVPACLALVFLIGASLLGMELYSRLLFREALAEAAALARSKRFSTASDVLNEGLAKVPFHPLPWREKKVLRRKAKAIKFYDDYLDTVEKADRLIGAHNYKRALDLLAALEKTLPDEAWKREVQRRIEACKAEMQARNLAVRAEGHLLLEHFEEARNVLLLLMKKYPFTAIARDVVIPLEVLSSPAGAEVWVGGDLRGKTPLRVFYSPFAGTELVIKRSGYRSVKTSLRGVQPPAVLFYLGRAGN
jgi:tetratricopeptide (TPR) repeat protein